MGIFRRKRVAPKPRPETEKRLEEARKRLEEQKRRHARELKTKAALEHALAENHIAQLMYEALSARRGDSTT